MLNRNVQIDATHSRAICNEIGERLRVSLPREASEMPQSMRRQLDRLHRLDENESPSIIPPMHDT
jgi:hypothetical protein